MLLRIGFLLTATGFWNSKIIMGSGGIEGLKLCMNHGSWLGLLFRMHCLSSALPPPT